jgi:VWFA-related protein
VAIVTFSDTVNVISPLTDNRAKLIQSIGTMKGAGASHIWDAVKYCMDDIVGPKSLSRRRAIVLMSDGADNALMFLGSGSQISFADLIEAVRRNDTLIIPIYLDTGDDDPFSKRLSKNARATMTMLAAESGGPYYKARKIEDLNGVYEQVINDLGKVYSLGYRPTNSASDGGWRSVKVQVLNHPDMVTRARPGYYPN